MTAQRRVILDLLRKQETHPTGDELYRLARRRLPRISLGTVYRNLELLSEAGLIRKLALGRTQRRFDGKLDQHYHARCLRCGRVEDVSLHPVSGLERAARRATGYRITGHHVELVGLCPECVRETGRKREETPEA